MASRKIPDDLIFEILTWLPAITLIRFKCVCKGWRDIIRSPVFVTNHHLRQTTLHQNKARVLVKQYFGREMRLCFTSLCSDDSFNTSPTATEILKFENHYNLKVHGHCNGLLCLSNIRGGLALCNPATKEVKLLPLSYINRPLDGNADWVYEHGFGFDSRSNDFKVIRFVIHLTDMKRISRVELYSLKNRSWKEIPRPDVIPLPYSLYYYAYSHIDGVFYWKAHGEGFQGREVILSFKIADELFEELPFPDLGDMPMGFDHLDLANFNGSLAAIVFSSSESVFTDKYVDIWVMKDSWVKQVRIGPIPRVKRPLGFWVNGELFLKGWKKASLVLYKPSTQELKKLGFNRTSQVIDYVESLVPLKDE